MRDGVEGTCRCELAFTRSDLRRAETCDHMKKKPPLLRRLRKKKRDRTRIVTGVCWYTESQWVRVKKTATDPERFEATFDEWSAMAEDALLELRKAGIIPVKVLIDPDEFSAWCKGKSKRNNASARARYVSEQLRRADEGNA